MTKRDFQAMEYAAETGSKAASEKDFSVHVRGTPPISALMQEFDSLLVQAVKNLEADSQRLQNIRATLWVNFVDRDAFGFKLTADEFRAVEAKHGVLGVLVSVLERVLNRVTSLQADVDKMMPLVEAVGACNPEQVPEAVYQAWRQPSEYQRTCAECSSDRSIVDIVVDGIVRGRYSSMDAMANNFAVVLRQNDALRAELRQLRGDIPNE